MTREEKIELIAVAELCRREGLAPLTVKTRLEEAGLEPDYVLVDGSRRRPLYLAARLLELHVALSRP